MIDSYSNHKRTWRVIFCIAFVVACAAMFYLRYSHRQYESLDWIWTLSKWMEHFQATGFAGIKDMPGDYNVPYLYVLAAISYLPFNPLFLIKGLSILFDFVLAYYAMRLVGLFETRLRFAIFFVVLALPTVWSNSSLWAQCDGIYTTFCLMGLYYGMRRSSIRSFAFFTLGFAFKLQSIFLLPIVFVLFMKRRIAARHLWTVPVSYALLMLPAILIGYPAARTLTIYLSQSQEYAELTLGAPNLYAFLEHAELPYATLSATGIVLAFLFLGALLFVLWRRRECLNDRIILISALTMTIFIPFLLPHMHERYFYLADILSCVVVFAVLSRHAIASGNVKESILQIAASVWRVILVAVLVQFSSYVRYLAFLRQDSPIDLRVTAVAMGLAGALTLWTLAQEIRQARNETLDAQKNW